MLPYRGDGSDRPVDLTALPLVRDAQLRKQWRYVGVYGERLMLCVGYARIGPLPQAWWAIWDRDKQALRERTRLVSPRRYVSLRGDRAFVRDGAVEIDLTLEPGRAVETASRHGRSWIWTRKRCGVRFRGNVRVGDELIAVDDLGCVDDSAGYHARRTDWEWSAGVGELDDGRAVGWNLVRGVNDAPTSSERSVWVDGEPFEPGPVVFASDLSSVSFPEGQALAFTAEATRERHDDLKLLRSDYVQPFGAFSGTLPRGLTLASGRGVMERHSALW